MTLFDEGIAEKFIGASPLSIYLEISTFWVMQVYNVGCCHVRANVTAYSIGPGLSWRHLASRMRENVQ